MTCGFPYCVFSLLIPRTCETIELVEKKSLIQPTIGYCTVFSKCNHNEVIVNLKIMKLAIHSTVFVDEEVT